MASTILQIDSPSRPGEVHTVLEQTLEDLLDFTHASAGWVGIAEPNGRLIFPARRGSFPESWLTLQQGQGNIWGFEIREGPTLLNDLPALPGLGEPPLRNLLSAPLTFEDSRRGQIVLANKTHGFTSHDAAVLQGVAHVLGRCICRLTKPGFIEPSLPASLLWLALGRVKQGVLVVDGKGALLFANPAWAQWTGFTQEELANRPAPFPFWVSHAQAVKSWNDELLRNAPLTAQSGETRAPRTAAQPTGIFPFRRRNNEVFWCEVETVVEEIAGNRCTIAFLTQVSSTSGKPAGDVTAPALDFSEHLPFGVVLVDQQGRIVWANSSFHQSMANVRGERIAGGERGTVDDPARPPEIPARLSTLCSPLSTLAPPSGSRFMLQDFFKVSSAASLQRLIRDPAMAENGKMGRLLLHSFKAGGEAHHTMAYWLAVRLADGPGFLFAFPEDWEAITLPDGLASVRYPLSSRLPIDGLSLLFRPNSPLEAWSRDWEDLTGLKRDDLKEIPSDVVLDWLFPHQRDRDFVADLLHDTDRHGAQAVLDILSPSRPLTARALSAGRESAESKGEGTTRKMMCTFLPITTGPSAHSSPAADRGKDEEAEAWLLVVGEPEAIVGEHTQAPRIVRQFARGLSYLLNHYLTVPIGLAELALDRDDLPAEVTSWFGQILESCHRSGQLLASLQDLSLGTHGDTMLVSLAELVQEFLDELALRKAERLYKLSVELRDPGAMIRANRRMIKVVLRHLFTNAEQALTNPSRARIAVRVYADSKTVSCQIEDTGEGLGAIDWTVALVPFYSTKGAFARDAAHASMEASGLGLTVSRHLLALHGGRLELHSQDEEGTIATILLPRADAVAAHTPGRVDPAEKAVSGELERQQS